MPSALTKNTSNGPAFVKSTATGSGVVKRPEPNQPKSSGGSIVS